MISNVIFPVLILSATYNILILGSVLFLRKVAVSEKRAIILSFLLFGTVTGILTAWVWPIDSSTYFNVFATFLGDLIYHLSTEYLGDPWILRVPQVYVVASMVLCGLVSLPAQWFYKRGLKMKRRVLGDGKPTSLGNP